MILQCPDCKARYLVPDSSITSAGRNVRCAKCTHTWFFKPPKREENEVLGDLDKLLNEINARPKGLAKGANLPALRGLATRGQKATALIMFTLATGFGLAAFSPAIIGLAPSKGLILADVGFAKTSEGDKKTYEITGKISNITGRIIPVPSLRVTLVDDEGSALQFWDFTSNNEPPIGPWSKLPFDTGELEAKISRGTRFVVEIGSTLELPLRRKPSVALKVEAPTESTTESTTEPAAPPAAPPESGT